MSRILQAITKALRMAGAEPDVPPSLVAVEKVLRRHGLALAVVDEEAPSLQLSARWLLHRVMERAKEAGEAEHGLTIRISRLIGRSQSSVTRALAGQHGVDDEARAILEEHLLHGKPNQLPPRQPLGPQRGR